MTITPPLHWLRQLQDKQAELQEIPLWGTAPHFPWEEFSKQLGSLLEIPDFRVYSVGQDFLPHDSPANPWGTNFKALSFQLDPLPGVLTWLFPLESLDTLTALLCGGPNSKGTGDLRFQEGFYQFVALQTCKLVQDLKIYPELNLRFCEEGHPISPPYFFLEIGLQLHEQTFFGKLVISAEFRTRFLSHFTTKPFSPVDFPLSKELDASLRLCLGHTRLSLPAWNTIQPGDFLLLDYCSYDPEAGKGGLDLFWEDMPIFSAKIKKNTLKIIDYSVYHGDVNSMDTEFSDHFSAEDDEFSFPDMDQDMLDDTDAEPPLPPEEEPQEEVPVQSPVETEAPSASETTAVKDIAFPVVVELDRIKMSLEKLLQLQPGNILELAAHPEQGVILTVHGKKVARGELLKIGEVLGVKILEVGKQN